MRMLKELIILFLTIAGGILVIAAGLIAVVLYIKYVFFPVFEWIEPHMEYHKAMSYQDLSHWPLAFLWSLPAIAAALPLLVVIAGVFKDYQPIATVSVRVIK